MRAPARLGHADKYTYVSHAILMVFNRSKTTIYMAQHMEAALSLRPEDPSV